MKIRNFWRHPTWYLWPLPGLAAFAAQRLLAEQPALAEQYSRGLFRWLSTPIAWITSFIPFSLTEMLLVIGCPLLLVGLVIWLVRLRRRTDRAARIGRLCRRLAWTVSILLLAFGLLHGLNYARQPVAESLGLSVRERSTAELFETTTWLAAKANALREACQEDDRGVFRLSLGVDETLRTAANAYVAAAADTPLLDGPGIRPKGVLLSHLWSYTGITGLYFPFLVESNVNTDVPAYLIPSTALHEIAHTRGFAREDEAGFVAFLAGVADPRPDFAYSVTINALSNCLNALYTADPTAWQKVADELSPACWRDLEANNAYWQQFAGPVQRASEQINDAYLQANLQEDGIKSYGRMIDLVLAWYEKQPAAGD